MRTMSARREIDDTPAADTGGGSAARVQATGHSKSDAERLSSLMRQAQDGDAASYRELLTTLLPLLRRVVRRRCGAMPAQDAEDIVQEILVSLHNARATYDPARPFLPWLMAIARNRVADAARRSVRRSAHEVAVERFDETFWGAETYTPADVYGDPEALHQAIRKLPKGQRTAIEMLKLREMSLKEAAAATSMSVGALKVAVHRAMKNLRAALG